MKSANKDMLEESYFLLFYVENVGKDCIVSYVQERKSGKLEESTTYT